jgi:hypothetical protein
MRIEVDSIFRATGGTPGKEDFLTLLESGGVKIERIVSRASSTPENKWYDQAYNEWFWWPVAGRFWSSRAASGLN